MELVTPGALARDLELGSGTWTRAATATANFGGVGGIVREGLGLAETKGFATRGACSCSMDTYLPDKDLSWAYIFTSTSGRRSAEDQLIHAETKVHRAKGCCP